jgi:hypothetical protein
MRGEPIIKSAVVVLLWGLAVNVSTARYSGGTGEPNDPYRIATPNDLNDIGNHSGDWGSHFVMANDVNLAQLTGSQFNIIGNSGTKFTGVFDGNGFAISNFAYRSTAKDNIGLFGYVTGASVEIKNVALIDPNVNAGTGDYVGALVGRVQQGTIASCSIGGGCVAGDWYVGGLAGGCEDGRIRTCRATASVSGYRNVGGLVGHFKGSNIRDSYAAGLVSGHKFAGGLVGMVDSGLLEDCHSAGSSSGSEGSVGGLVGTNQGTIRNCGSMFVVVIGGDSGAGGLVGHNLGAIRKSFATGNVSGGDCTGGLVGLHGAVTHQGRIIENSYSTCIVSGDRYVGGLVGNDNISYIRKSFSTGRVSGSEYVGGFLGANVEGSIDNACFWDTESSLRNNMCGVQWYGGTGCNNANGRPTAEMQMKSTFADAGWDFVEVWNIGEDQTYPFLRTHPAGDIDHDNRVDWPDLAILAGHWLEEWK